MVLKPEKEKEAEAIFHKWGLDFAIVGKTTDDLRFRIFHQGEEVANLPIKELGDEAPEYDRPYVEPKPATPLLASALQDPKDYGATLKTILGSPNMASRRWVWEQYDHFIQGNTVQKPGGDAAVVRVEDGPKALAFTLDVTPRYCEADPFEGGKQAVAEAYRNLSAVGAEPLAITDNLNFGNPERPEIMGQFVYAIKGIGAACAALDFPVVSGNVSLYNETNGQGILPTPAIGGVGLIEDYTTSSTIAFKAEGEAIILVGDTTDNMGQTAYLSIIEGREEGAPPHVDLAKERLAGDRIRGLIRGGHITASHDLSDGGLAVGLAEMAMAGRMGANIDGLALVHDNPLAALYAEDQARYLVTAPKGSAPAVVQELQEAGVSARIIGRTGGKDLTVGSLMSISVEGMRQAHENWFPAFMAPDISGLAAE